MKVSGYSKPTCSKDYLVFPRPDGQQLIFQISIAYNPVKFEDKFKEPQPIIMTKAGTGEKFAYEDDPSYIEAKKDYHLAKVYFNLYNAIKDSPGVEFETVDESKFATYKNLESELLEWMTDHEYDLLWKKYSELCGLSSNHIKEATNSFVAKIAAGLV